MDKKKHKINWKTLMQDILDKNGELMSGKCIVEAQRDLEQNIEATFYIKSEEADPPDTVQALAQGLQSQSFNFTIDYFCRVGAGIPASSAIPGIRPFDHFREFNLIEYKGINQTLTMRDLRGYLGRALNFETTFKKKYLLGKITLTLLLANEPTELLHNPDHVFEKLTPWKYYLNYFKVPIYLLLQDRMRHIQGGEPLAWLQVLEADAQHQMQVWSGIIAQNLAGGEDLEPMMMRINERAYRTMVKKMRP